MATLSSTTFSSGTIKKIVSSYDGAQMYLITSGTDYIYSSTNKGTSWTSITASGSLAWSALACSNTGGTYVIGSSGTSLYYSTNKGSTWATSTTYTYTTGTIASLAISDTGKYQYVGTSDGKLYYSVNTATSFAQSATTWTTTSMNTLACNTDGVFVWVGSTSAAIGIYRSIDYGQNFTQIAASVLINNIAVDSVGSTVAYTVNNANYITVTTNNGLNWKNYTIPGGNITTQNALAVSQDGTKIFATIGTTNYAYYITRPIATPFYGNVLLTADNTYGRLNLGTYGSRAASAVSGDGNYYVGGVVNASSNQTISVSISTGSASVTASATNIVSSAGELSTVFEGYSTGTKATTTKIVVPTVGDLCNVFAPYTNGDNASTTGIVTNGQDLRLIFQKKGVAAVSALPTLVNSTYTSWAWQGNFSGTAPISDSNRYVAMSETGQHIIACPAGSSTNGYFPNYFVNISNDYGLTWSYLYTLYNGNNILVNGFVSISGNGKYHLYTDPGNVCLVSNNYGMSYISFALNNYGPATFSYDGTKMLFMGGFNKAIWSAGDTGYSYTGATTAPSLTNFQDLKTLARNYFAANPTNPAIDLTDNQGNPTTGGTAMSGDGNYIYWPMRYNSSGYIISSNGGTTWSYILYNNISTLPVGQYGKSNSRLYVIALGGGGNGGSYGKEMSYDGKYIYLISTINDYTSSGPTIAVNSNYGAANSWSFYSLSNYGSDKLYKDRMTNPFLGFGDVIQWSISKDLKLISYTTSTNLYVGMTQTSTSFIAGSYQNHLTKYSSTSAITGSEEIIDFRDGIFDDIILTIMGATYNTSFTSSYFLPYYPTHGGIYGHSYSYDGTAGFIKDASGNHYMTRYYGPLTPSSVYLYKVFSKGSYATSNDNNVTDRCISDNGKFIIGMISSAFRVANAYLSTDYGVTWNLITSLSSAGATRPPSCVSMSASGRFQVFSAGNPVTGLWVSNNYGTTFTGSLCTSANNWGFTYVNNIYAVISANGHKILAFDPWGQAWLISKDLLYRFSSSSTVTNIGSLVTLNAGQGNNGVVTAGISGNANVIILINNTNFFVSTNGGTSFITYAVSSMSGYNGNYTWPGDGAGKAAALSYNGQYICYSSLQGRIMVNNNYGAANSWSTYITSFQFPSIVSMSKTGQVITYCPPQCNGYTIFTYGISTNYGATWTSNPGNFNEIGAAMYSQNTFYAGWWCTNISYDGSALFAIDLSGNFYMHRGITK
jgi:hypothetical protein